jgi:AcrR family transcriptional regulator
MITPRTRNRKGEGGHLRDQILQAAIEQLGRLGDVDALGMREVAAACGITPPSVYAHFGNKEALLRAVIGAMFAEFDRTLDAAVLDARDPCDALARRCHAYAAFGAEHPGRYRVLFSATNLGPAAVGDDQPHPGAASFFTLVATVERCIAAGAVVAQPADLLAVELWAVLHGIVDLRLTKPELPWPPADLLVDNALGHLGLAGPTPKTSRTPTTQRRKAPTRGQG